MDEYCTTDQRIAFRMGSKVRPANRNALKTANMVFSTSEKYRKLAGHAREV
jgi:hypothetical protein